MDLNISFCIYILLFGELREDIRCCSFYVLVYLVINTFGCFLYLSNKKTFLCLSDSVILFLLLYNKYFSYDSVTFNGLNIVLFTSSVF